MIRTVKIIIYHLASNPKKLFLADGLGAFLTAFLLFVVLRKFNEYSIMPETILTYLSIIAVFIGIYSITCFKLLKENWTPFIIAISIANRLYCILTIGLLLVYQNTLTILGITYFIIEIVIIFGLAYIELEVARSFKQNRINGHQYLKCSQASS